MNLRQLYLTKNDCYKSGRRHTVRGILVHSTGANNPNLKRYVGPDDGLLGKNAYDNHWNRPRPDGVQICMHAFIGKLADGSIATYQTLPWDMVGWHSGSGRLGSAKNANNTGYIGFEICEDGLTDPVYFSKVYTEAVELCAHLCREYKLDPLADGVLLCHSEGSARGIASAHSDVLHWFPRHKKSMDTFRQDVAALLRQKPATGTAIMGKAVATAQQMAAYLRAKNPAAPDYAQLYLDEGEKEGVRGDIAFAQSCLETGHWTFGGDVRPDQNNFCGLGATGGGEPGNRFATPQLGIRAQVQHLKAYADTEPLQGSCVDPRFQWVTRGSAPYVEWLGIPDNPSGKGWAAGKNYGAKILAILDAIQKTVPPKTDDRLQQLQEENKRLQAENAELLQLLRDIENACSKRLEQVRV